MMISGLLASVFATGVAALGTTVAAPCACADPAHCAPIAAAAAADREIFAFFDDNKTWPNLDYEVATTACAYMDGPAEQVDPAFVCHAHSKGVRAVRNAPFAKDQLGTIGNSTVRAMWVAMWLETVKSEHLDGLNIDIEQYEGPREPLTSLVAELSAALKGFNPHLQLSFDLAIFPSGQAEHYDHAALSQHLDFIFPMAYDEPWGSKVAAANSPLAALRRGVAEYVGLGVPASKLVVGLPWYGWDWPCTTNATDAPCDVVPPCGRPWFGWATQVGYSNIQAKLKASSATLRTDNVSITRYFDYTVATGDAIGRHQLWFDDPVTLAQKYRACKDLGVRGVGFWTADMPDYTTDQGTMMWAAVAKGFAATPSSASPLQGGGM